ncbi:MULTISPECIES: hypothetical protein [unclassified Gordonia (in: high G+C Gram-positive bacteria)]
MSITVVLLVISAVLLVLGAALREVEVGSDGASRRGAPAHRLTLVTAGCVIVAACLTLQRLAEMAL